MLEPANLKTPEDYERLDAWFEGHLRDATFSARAFELIEVCFERVGKVPRLPDVAFRYHADRWLSVCWHLFHALHGPIQAGDQDPLVKDVLKTMCDFCLLTDKHPRALRFTILVSEFWKWDCYNERLLSLMPPVFLAERPAMQPYFDAWADQAAEWENDMIRMGQMGY